MSFDSANSNGGTPSSGISFSHSLGYGSNNARIVLVGIHTVGGVDTYVSSCTYNGVPMVPLTYRIETYSGYDSALFVYALLDTTLPSSSGFYTVSATVLGTTNPTDGVVIASSYNGVKQSLPLFSTDSSQHSPSASGQFSSNVTAQGVAGLVVDFSAVHRVVPANSMTPGTGQTERQDRNQNTSIMVTSEKAYSSSGSVTMAQTPNGNYWSDLQVLLELENAASISLLGYQGYSASHGASLSGNYTCHSGENRKLLVAAGAECPYGAIDVDYIRYNSVDLTKLVEVDHTASYTNLAWFYLDEDDFPSTPGSYTIEISFSDYHHPGHMMVIELSGAKQGTVEVYNNSESASTTVINTTITTVVDYSWIIGAVISSTDNTFTPDTGQTELIDQIGGGGGAAACLGYEIINLATSTNMQWTASESQFRLLQIVLAIPPSSTPLDVPTNVLLFGEDF